MPGASAIHDLPHCTIAGIKVYYSSFRTNWSQRLASRKYVDIAGEAHDWTGRDSLRCSITVRLHNTIEPGLYPGTWNKLREVLLKGEIIELRHPDIGVFSCRPASTAFEINPERSTAGIDVEIELIESIKSADQPTKFSAAKSDAASAAEDADKAINLMGLDYPDGMRDPSFGEMLDAIASFPATFSHELNGLIQSTVGLVDQMYETLQALCNAESYLPGSLKTVSVSPYRWLLETSLETMRAALAEALAAATAGAQATKTAIAAGDTTFAALSFDLGVDVGVLIRLNPGLLGKTTITKGSKVLYLAA